ncbi:MAG TPA: hypothetical protein VGE02_05060, partial [Gemmatimonadales bacterium]
ALAGDVPGGATLAPATRGMLRDELGHLPESGALAFAEQVTRQVAHPLGATHDGRAPAERERAVAARVAEILRTARGGDAAAAHAATLLADDVPLLSAFFQNLDLLPAGDATSDAVALLVMEAMGLLGGG